MMGISYAVMIMSSGICVLVGVWNWFSSRSPYGSKRRGASVKRALMVHRKRKITENKEMGVLIDRLVYFIDSI